MAKAIPDMFSRMKTARLSHKKNEGLSISVRLSVSLALVLLLVLLLVTALSADSPACPVPLTDRQRFGFVATSGDWHANFDYASLKAGWVVDMAHSNHTSLPQGIDRLLLIRVHTGYVVNEAVLGPLVDANPGVIWAVGNEPDSIYQDDVMPEDYARIYHDIYTFIKNRDKSSQISPGGIVQPSPLRLEYLDLILVAYQDRYGRPMPVDLWNIHNAILDEKRGGAGADIPPGIDAEEGVRRTPDDNDNMTIFTDQIWAFRQWMAARGYAGYPLIVTEYGVLMGEAWFPQFDAERVGAFMHNTFDFFTSATHPALGDPNDGNRLVQRWAWFSLDVQPFDPITFVGFNGNLFDPETMAITAHGQNYASYTSGFPPLSYVDLAIRTLKALPTSDLASPTQTIDRSVEVSIGNLGTGSSGAFKVVLDYDGPTSGQLEQWINDLPHSSSQTVIFQLANLEPGSYDVFVLLDPDAQVPESRECNNEASVTILAPAHRFYVPLVPNRVSGSITSQVALMDISSDSVSLLQLKPADAVPGFHEFDLPTANSYPGQLIIDAQGSIWVSQRDGNKIARFDPQIESWQGYDIPTADSQPWGLALDGSGNLWFAETAANQIGKLEMSSGVITEYAIPTLDSEPWEVARGNDGMIWFTQRAGNQIARLNPSTGNVTEYPVPTSDSEPSGLAAYGNYLWFTQPAANKIGRLKILDGSFREWPMETPDSAPQDLVVTSEGVLWLTERQGNQLATASVSTNWFFTELPLRTNDSEPFGIAVQGDVARWFTQKAKNRLGRYTGSIPPDEYLLPTVNSQSTDIKVDGDGCAWYTAPGINRIGRLCLPVDYDLRYLPLVSKN